MSEELESQTAASPMPQEQRDEESATSSGVTPKYEQGTEEQYQQQPHYHAGNNFSQRGSRNGRQGQQRGGRYGSNKYNYNSNGNAGQYNRYNNNNMGGNTRNYHNNGYKPHRGNMNAAAAINMQWPGYYNPQLYYMSPQIPQTNKATSVELSPSSSPVSSSASGTPTPTGKKIEITTKTGEHLDLSALHHNHQSVHHSMETTTTGIAQPTASESFSSPEIPVETPSTISTEAPSKEDDKVEAKSNAKSEESISEAEKTKREFLEQIKLRKAALEKKKHEQLEASKPQKIVEDDSKAKEAPATESTQNVVSKEEGANDSNVKAVNESQPSGASDSETGKTVTTFAEALKKKKEEAKLSSEASPANEEPIETEKVDIANVQEDEASPNDEQNTEKTIGEEQEGQAREEPDVETEAPEEVSREAEVPEVKEQTPKETPEETQKDSADDLTVTQLLEKLRVASPIEDIYAFKYPSTIESPDPRYKKSHIKYTYGPAFLLQFKDKVKVVADDEWVQKAASKIVIPPGMNKTGRPRDPSLFGGAGRMNSGGDFRKSGSMRNMDARSNSRNSSKKKSKRMGDDRRSNRSYTSRRDRERDRERGDDFERREDDKPKEEVAPLVPSANRWVPKSKVKKTEKKLAPDGVTELLDKEDAERKMKSLLNKLTLEMFDQISSEILQIANQSKWEKEGETLKVVIEEVFRKACDEPHWSSMYAQLCGKLVKELDPEIKDETNEGKTGPKLVLHYLVARCHEEFDKGWSDRLPTKEDGTPLEPEMMSDEYYKAAAAKRRGLGLVRFIGFLYRLNLLTGKMMFECFRRLMKDLTNTPSEETLESVVELLSTVGEQFETDSFSAGQLTLEGSALLDSLFASLQNIIDNAEISSRMKFKLIDIRELREEKHWNSNKKEDGPKTIQQIHQEDEKQRQLKNNSRSNSRRMNSSMGSRNSFRRETPTVSKDNFISTRSSSQRHTQKPVQKEEPRQPQKTATNMFSALMDSNDDD